MGRRTTPRGTAVGALAIVCLAAWLAGCLTVGRYDMGRIHRDAAALPRDPVIVVHGFLGSKLRNVRTHEGVWGKVINALRRGRPDDLALPIDRLPITDNRDDLVPYAICNRLAGIKIYGALLDTLEETGGYRSGDIDDPKPGDSLFVYTYDWRRDIVESALGFGDAIRRLRSRLDAPDLRFDVVAHSMGGLLAAYYLKYGARDVLGDAEPAMPTYAGADDIARLVLLGTPSRGTMSAFQILNTGFALTMSPREIFTMPSIYQLMPAGGDGHFLDLQGKATDVDLYDAGTWVRNGWSVFNPAIAGSDGPPPGAERFLEAALDRARRFHGALARETPGGPPVPVHLFGSDCMPTMDQVVVEPQEDRVRLHFPDQTATFGNARALGRIALTPGDGTVTADSLLAFGPGPAHGPNVSTFLFCSTHGIMFSNPGLQDNLLHVLLGNATRRAVVDPSPQAAGSGGPVHPAGAPVLDR